VLVGQKSARSTGLTAQQPELPMTKATQHRPASNKAVPMVSRSLRDSIPPMPRPDAIPALTGLRGLAALGVVISNALAYVPGFAQSPSIWYTEGRALVDLGVAAFFVLSGFLIHYNYGDVVATYGRRAIRELFLARLARLYPLFLVVVLALSITGHTPRATALPFYLTLTQSWVYFLWHGHPLMDQVPLGTMAITWTLSSLFLCYLLYPILVAPLLRRARQLPPLGYAFGAATAGLLLSGFLYATRNSLDAVAIRHLGGARMTATALPPDESFVSWLVYYSPYLRFLEFSIGAAAACTYRHILGRSIARDLAAKMWSPSVAIAAVALVQLVIGLPPIGFVSGPVLQFLHLASGTLLMVPLAVLLISVALHPGSRPSKFLCNRWPLFVGDVSYPIYLVQFSVIGSLATVFAPFAPNYWGHVLSIWLRVLVSLAQVVGLALIAHVAIEGPVRRWFGRHVLTLGRSELPLPGASLLLIMEGRPGGAQSAGEPARD
jgi:peptidoglycan/LPS O-acetylase OafA/YrhL